MEPPSCGPTHEAGTGQSLHVLSSFVRYQFICSSGKNTCSLNFITTATTTDWAPISCRQGLSIILQTSWQQIQVSPFCRRGDKGRKGEVISSESGWVQGPVTIQSLMRILLHLPQKLGAPPTASGETGTSQLRRLWGQFSWGPSPFSCSGGGQAPPLQCSAVSLSLRGPALWLPASHTLSALTTSAFLSFPVHVLIKNKPKYKHVDLIKACNNPLLLLF